MNNNYSKRSINNNTNNSLQIKEESSTIISTVYKYSPLIFATIAVGVGIIALKEIKNVRKELNTFKKEQASLKPQSDPSLIKKLEAMDEQIKKISKYLSSIEKSKSKSIKKELPDNTNNIKKEPVLNTESKELSKQSSDIKELKDEDIEYEYEEVTDDEQ